MVRMTFLVLLAALLPNAALSMPAPNPSDAHIAVALVEGCPVSTEVRRTGPPASRLCREQSGGTGPLLSDAFCVGASNPREIYWIEEAGPGQFSEECFTVELEVTVNGTDQILPASHGWLINTGSGDRRPWVGVTLPANVEVDVDV